MPTILSVILKNDKAIQGVLGRNGTDSSVFLATPITQAWRPVFSFYPPPQSYLTARSNDKSDFPTGAQNRKYSGGRGAPILGPDPPESSDISDFLGVAGFARGGGAGPFWDVRGGAPPPYFAALQFPAFPDPEIFSFLGGRGLKFSAR